MLVGLFLFLCLIPSQLGKHFWPQWSYVLGIRVDYLSPTFYLLDLIWLLIFLNEIIRHKKERPVIKKKKIKSVIAIVVFIFLNIVLASNPQVAVYKWLRGLQYLITIFYFQKHKKEIKDKLLKVIPVWISVESLLAVGQMAKNGSLNGIFYWIGERRFNFNTIGVAQFSIFGKGMIRAYGSFSHPNSLAAFLLVSLILWFFYKDKVDKLWWWIIFYLAIFGIALSGSRSIWLLSLFSLAIIFLKKVKEKSRLIAIFFFFMGLVVFLLRLINQEYLLTDYLNGWDVNSWEKRSQLNLAALEMVKKAPLVGVGLGNYLVRLVEFQSDKKIFWLQPSHNIFLLLLSEIGILGLLPLFFFLFKKIKEKNFDFLTKIIIVVIVASGMIDHYWLTLPQNLWLLVMLIGIA